jgi:hypothetical protein
MVVNGTLGFVNIEANGTVTERVVPAGHVIELPYAQVRIAQLLLLGHETHCTSVVRCLQV